MSKEDVILKLLLGAKNASESSRVLRRAGYYGKWDENDKYLTNASGTYVYDGKPELFLQEWDDTVTDQIESRLKLYLPSEFYDYLVVSSENRNEGNPRGCGLRLLFSANDERDYDLDEEDFEEELEDDEDNKYKFTEAQISELFFHTCEALETILPEFTPSSLDFYIRIQFWSDNDYGENESYFISAGRFFDDSFALKNPPADAQTLQDFIDKIKVIPRGEARKATAINEIAFPKECRFKSYDFYANTDSQAYFRYYTQEEAYAASAVKDELIRCLNSATKVFKYKSPFTVYVLIESRYGIDYGSYTYTLYFDGKAVTEKN